MDKKVLNHIRTSVEEKRRNLKSWLETAPASEKECALDGAEEQPVLDHLTVLDETLERVEDGTLGVCEVCHGAVDQSVLEIDYTATICLDCLTEPQRRQLEDELEFSSEIQRALLPQHAPEIPGLEVGAFSRPAQIIGGDYFDFFRFKSGAYGLAIADVSGHGFSASLLLSGLQTALHTLAAETDSVTEVVQRINRYYLHNTALTTFITLFLAQYDPASRLLTYANAGHNPPLVHRRADNTLPAWLQPTGAAVGLMEDYHLDSAQVSFGPQDVLLLYTDGVTELTDPAADFFGPQRLAELVASNASLAAQDLISALRRGLDDFHGPGLPADDVTMVAVKAMP